MVEWIPALLQEDSALSLEIAASYACASSYLTWRSVIDHKNLIAVIPAQSVVARFVIERVKSALLCL